MFVFENRFWLNLHQFLRDEAYRRSKAAPDLNSTDLNASDRAAWISAIDRYDDLFKRDLVFDERSRRMSSALGMTKDSACPPSSLEGTLDAKSRKWAAASLLTLKRKPRHDLAGTRSGPCPSDSRDGAVSTRKYAPR